MNILINASLFLSLYFVVFLVMTYIENHRSFRFPSSTNRQFSGKLPSATIIVPAWNEEATLSGTVNCLLKLDYPSELLKIIIVDDGSTDNTLSMARSFESYPQVKVLTKENGGKHTALNLGIENCTTDIVGCLDADSFADPQALREIVPYFDNKEVMAVTPSVQVHQPNTILRKIQGVEYMIGEFTRKIFSCLNGLYVTPGPFSFYRKEVFEKIGNFAQGYNTEDMEMALRMQSHRMKIDNAHTALVYTISPSSLRALYKQRVRWSTGFLKNVFFSYRHILLSPKYGYLGMLIIPIAVASIFTTLFFSFVFLKTLGQALYKNYLEYTAIGFHPHFSLPHFDWFSINLGFSRMLIYFLLLSTLFFIYMGIRLAKRKKIFSFDILYFVLLYGLIAPVWLAWALYNFVTAKDTVWR